jgi:hypothetical protein
MFEIAAIKLNEDLFLEDVLGFCYENVVFPLVTED